VIAPVDKIGATVASRKKKMAKAYVAKTKNSPRRNDWVVGLFTSIGATF